VSTKLIRFETVILKRQLYLGKPAVLYVQPEYGERLRDEIELNVTIARIGDFLKNSCKDIRVYFTGNLDLAKKIV